MITHKRKWNSYIKNNNDPYGKCCVDVARKAMELLDKEIKDFEPKVALLSGEDGIDVHKKITEGAVNYLKLGGLLAFEVGLGDAKRLAELVSSNNSYENIKIVKDLAGIKRVVLAIKK